MRGSGGGGHGEISDFSSGEELFKAFISRLVMKELVLLGHEEILFHFSLSSPGARRHGGRQLRERDWEVGSTEIYGLRKGGVG